MSLTRLERDLVAKPWGSRQLGAVLCSSPTADPIGEVWFRAPTGSAMSDPELLVKLLFTERPLSVQVHPDDAQAKVRGFARGKSEAWHVIAARPAASIAIGPTAPLTNAQLRAAAEDGTIVALLDWKPARVGDFWYAPAGTIHAIGAGLTLIEIQQNADVTYRLYDYGSEREVQVDEAVAVATLLPYFAPFVPHEVCPGRRVMMAGGAFVVEHWSGDWSATIAPAQGRPAWLVPLNGDVTIGQQSLTPGEVWIADEVHRIAFHGACEMLAAYPGSDVHRPLLARASAARCRKRGCRGGPATRSPAAVMSRHAVMTSGTPTS